jgi:hypothetical protein
MSALGRAIDQALLEAGLVLDEEADLEVEPLESEEVLLESDLAAAVSLPPSFAVVGLPRESVR